MKTTYRKVGMRYAILMVLGMALAIVAKPNKAQAIGLSPCVQACIQRLKNCNLSCIDSGKTDCSSCVDLEQVCIETCNGD
jgi:hypothetical protein